jgi:hypothetical protein
VGDGVVVALAVGVRVGDGVDVGVGVGVSVAVAVGGRVGDDVGVGLSVGVGVPSKASVGFAEGAWTTGENSEDVGGVIRSCKMARNRSRAAKNQ